MDHPLSAKEQIEIDFWRDSREESPGADSIRNIVNKFSESRVLLAKLQHFDELFRGGMILELGAGQGWASCFVKRLYPGATVIATDISEYAVRSVPKWERFFETKLDKTVACRSYEMPFDDGSIDLVWCFQAAHHFVAHRRTFAELRRVLRPGGAGLYLHEPACCPFIHRLARARVNAKRPAVPEDVLKCSEMRRLARDAGFSVELRRDPTTTSRNPIETVYYLVLQRSRLLRALLPCTTDFVFRKA
ncbi:MAG TPA: class I SAM-dependent methyltransferase [Armatimonadota bacterium]|jgi:SAM-dependent methyltransferase